MKKFKCKCGSDRFLEVYNVFINEFSVELLPENNLSMVDKEHLKNHLIGFECAECRESNEELNEGLTNPYTHIGTNGSRLCEAVVLELTNKLLAGDTFPVTE